jgi:plastocyanin
MIRIAVAAVALLALAAGVAQAHSNRTVLKISAAPGAALKFSTTRLSASPGTVTIQMKNPSILPHDVSIKGNGVHARGKVVGRGGTSTVTAKLKRGRYVFYCHVAGHEQAGMKGTLTVR